MNVCSILAYFPRRGHRHICGGDETRRSIAGEVRLPSKNILSSNAPKAPRLKRPGGLRGGRRQRVCLVDPRRPPNRFVVGRRALGRARRAHTKGDADVNSRSIVGRHAHPHPRRACRRGGRLVEASGDQATQDAQCLPSLRSRTGSGKQQQDEVILKSAYCQAFSKRERTSAASLFLFCICRLRQSP